MPTRAYKPKEKANVESGVKVVTNWVIHYLGDRTFVDVDDTNEAIIEASTGSMTGHRSAVTSAADETGSPRSADLIDLPDHPWQEVTWKKAKVSRTCTSRSPRSIVPASHAGTIVDVRIVGTHLDVLAGGDVIATHRLGTKKHSFVTDPDHAPATQGDTTGLWTRAYFLRQATKVGPHTVDALTRLHGKKIEAQASSAPRHCSCRQGRQSGPTQAACTTITSDQTRPISYTAIKHQITAIRAQARQRPTTAPVASAPPPVWARDTSRAHLTGVDQFRLDTPPVTMSERTAPMSDNHLTTDDMAVFTQLRMTAFGQTIIDIANDSAYDEWTFLHKIHHALDIELAARAERRVFKLLKDSHTPNPAACVEDLPTRPTGLCPVTLSTGSPRAPGSRTQATWSSSAKPASASTTIRPKHWSTPPAVRTTPSPTGGLTIWATG